MTLKTAIQRYASRALMFRSKKLRLTALMLVFFFSASTEVVLASDTCQVSVVQALVDSSNAANRHVAPQHKHTKAVLAAWEVWGKEYLATHGHAYVPPKRTYAPGKMLRPRKPNGAFKFECVPPVLQTEDARVTDLLTDFVPTEDLDTLPLSLPSPDLMATQTPGISGSLPGAQDYYPSYPPVFGGSSGGNGGSTTPTTPTAPTSPTTPVTPPTTVTPEPGSFVLLGTGMAALLGLGKRARSSQRSR